MAGSQERFHALDGLRAFALLLGIVLHATMSFFLGIPARDSSQSTTLAVTFYVIHIFRMSLFYVIAGFFAHLLFHRRGARGFVADRAKRILVPMTAGWVILAPATIAVTIWGLSRTFPAGTEANGNAAALAPRGFPLTHLWFLYYLAFFYPIVLLLRGVVTFVDGNGTIRTRLDAVIRGAISLRLAPFALAAPTIAVLHFNPAWAVWFGVPTPDHGLMPQLSAVVAYGTAFAFGWLLHRQVSTLEILQRQWRTNLLVAAGLTITCLGIAGLTPDLAAPAAIEGGPAMRLLYASAYALAIWYWSFGLIGAALRFLSAASGVRRYIADASYWLYLVHVPIVFALQVLLMNVPLHWTIKLPAILAITAAVLFSSYHYLVRPTALGELLNGQRYPRRRTAVPDPAFVPGSAPIASAFAPDPGSAPSTPIAELVNVTKRYGKTAALSGLSLAVRPGELLALLGPNGAGKSTAIGLWLGTLVPDEGASFVLAGSPLDVNSRLATGVMMQEVALSPMLTAREHVTLASSYYRNPLPVDETLSITGIASLADLRYGRLSAGQKRQVQFAIAACGRPRLLFLDEPTVGLDVEARAAMWHNVRRLVADGCSVVLTTHYLEEAEALADRVAVLVKGTLIAEGSVDEMRALVSRKRIRCTSSLAVEDVRGWPGVVDAIREQQVLHVTASDAESVVLSLLTADRGLRHLEVERASLADAFNALTREAA